MNRWYTIKAADVRGAADISIYEEIGGFGVTAKQFAEDLKALGDVSHINLRIHSPVVMCLKASPSITCYGIIRQTLRFISMVLRLQWLRWSQWLAIVL